MFAGLGALSFWSGEQMPYRVAAPRPGMFHHVREPSEGPRVKYYYGSRP
jgi:hypothetical protein